MVNKCTSIQPITIACIVQGPRENIKHEGIFTWPMEDIGKGILEPKYHIRWSVFINIEQLWLEHIHNSEGCRSS